MYLLEAKGEAAFELMAALFDPITDIMSDADILACIQTDQRMKAAKFALQRHPKEIILILATCYGVQPEEYQKTAPEMLADLLKVANDPTVVGLFQSQVQSSEANSGSAMENTEEKG